jgi:Putative transmembrane protein (PGPGW)
VAGGSVVLLGLVLIPLPGPGIPVVVAGIALLALEFAWAARLRDYGRDLWARVRLAPSTTP